MTLSHGYEGLPDAVNFAVDPAPFPYERLINVALDCNSALIEVKWSKCRETSCLHADAAAMREIATPV